MRRKPAGSMNHQRSVAARFSAAASTYDRHSVVQDRAADYVMGLVNGLEPNLRILEIGCGSGILTRKLVRLLRESTICAVDISAAMIRMAQARLAGNGRITWVVGDLDSVRNGRKFDVAVSSSSLHWITPLEAAFKGIGALLVEGGHLVFSLMIEGTLSELHSARERIAPHKPAAAKLPSEGEVLESLGRAGLEVVSHEKIASKEEFSSASDLMKCLHEQGLTGGRFSSGTTPLTRTELRALVSDYDSNYKSERGGVFATYEILYVVAIRPRDPGN